MCVCVRVVMCVSLHVRVCVRAVAGVHTHVYERVCVYVSINIGVRE
jgi:hypothetical protein